MTPEERARLRALADAATPEPWRACCANQPDSHPCRLITAGPDAHGVATTHVDYDIGLRADQLFIAASRAAVPALLDQVDRLEQEIGEARNLAFRAAQKLEAREAEHAAAIERPRVSEEQRDASGIALAAVTAERDRVSSNKEHGNG